MRGRLLIDCYMQILMKVSSHHRYYMCDIEMLISNSHYTNTESMPPASSKIQIVSCLHISLWRRRISLLTGMFRGGK